MALQWWHHPQATLYRQGPGGRLFLSPQYNCPSAPDGVLELAVVVAIQPHLKNCRCYTASRLIRGPTPLPGWASGAAKTPLSGQQQNGSWVPATPTASCLFSYPCSRPFHPSSSSVGFKMSQANPACSNPACSNCPRRPRRPRRRISRHDITAVVPIPTEIVRPCPCIVTASGS